MLRASITEDGAPWFTIQGLLGRMLLSVGDYVKQTSQPEWGIGRVISIGESEQVTIFFVSGGRRIFKITSPELKLVVDRGDPLLELAGKLDWKRAGRSLYIVELNAKVFDWDRRFFEANLHWIPRSPCVYVGMTERDAGVKSRVGVSR
jgi:hypothetical protein